MQRSKKRKAAKVNAVSAAQPTVQPSSAPSAPPSSHAGRIPLWARRLTTGLLALLGAYGSYIAVLQYWAPNLVVSPALEVNPDRPLTSRFQITNNNPVLSVTFQRQLGLIKIVGGPPTGPTTFESYARPGMNSKRPPEISVPRPPVLLRPNEAETINMEEESEMFSRAEPVAFADIAIMIQYKVAWWPQWRERFYRFATDKGADGKLHWVYKAMPDA